MKKKFSGEILVIGPHSFTKAQKFAILADGTRVIEMRDISIHSKRAMSLSVLFDSDIADIHDQDYVRADVTIKISHASKKGTKKWPL